MQLKQYFEIRESETKTG